MLSIPMTIFTIAIFYSFLKILFILETEEGREKHQFVVSLSYAFIGWFLYVPWLGIEPTTLV